MIDGRVYIARNREVRVVRLVERCAAAAGDEVVKAVADRAIVEMVVPAEDGGYVIFHEERMQKLLRIVVRSVRTDGERAFVEENEYVFRLRLG